MKKLINTILFSLFLLTSTFAQDFHGAKPHLKHYQALYILNSNDAKHIQGTLRNINNALNDPRLKGKLTVELIAFGDGVAVYQKGNQFDSTLQALQKKGVLLAQCQNTIEERHIQKSSLYNYISYVPSGNGEIIIRAQEGWATLHP